mgnify:CR=1 FL=1
MITKKLEIQLKDSEFKANLFTYFLDNSPGNRSGEKKTGCTDLSWRRLSDDF